MCVKKVKCVKKTVTIARCRVSAYCWPYLFTTFILVSLFKKYVI